MSYEDEVSTLTIDKLEPADDNTYRCEAANKLGKVETQCTLTVHGKPH